MIEDLKADSARWDLERRQQSASRNSNSGGTHVSRESNAVFIKSSNSPVVQYRNSDTHQSRQYYGPTAETGYASADSHHYGDATPRYPGTGSGVYQGASNPYPNQQYTTSPTYGQATYAQPGQFSSTPGNVQFSVPGSGYGQAGQEPPYTLVNANLNTRARPEAQPMYASDPYGASRDVRDARDDPIPRDARGVPVTTMASSRTVYATTGNSPSQAYPTAGSGGSYYSQNQAAPGASYVAAQPSDPFYGRGAYSRRP